ncbi:hypothetical protein GCM10020221_28850 [Streptomyces thioluteus]|uniref:CU044_5270 family protein n=1 Tax=Streptomyces thioluteus TaxID=66431 RepID=A0ABN3WXD4_STRTU
MTGNEKDALDFPGADRLRAAGRVAPPSPDVIAAALAAVRQAAAGPGEENAVESVELEREPVAEIVPVRKWRRRMPVLVSAAAVVAVALGVAFQPWSDSGGVQGSPATQRTAVRERAGTAPYWKVRTFHYERAFHEGKAANNYEQTEWLSRGGQRIRTGPDGPVRELPISEPMTFKVCEQLFTWDELGKLPTDPAALRSRLVGKATGADARQGLFNGIEELLAGSPAGLPLRKALFKVLTDVPGVRVTAGVKSDMTARVGTAVEIEWDGWRRRVIVETDTFHVVESRDTARGNSQIWGTVKLRDGEVATQTSYIEIAPAWEAPKPSPSAGRRLSRKPSPTTG